MSDLSSEKKTVYALLADNKADFLIPDYQRNYSWGQEHCEKLWTDLVTFAIPNNDAASFDNNEEYFLGTILTFKNDYKQKEVIDGQQRLITFMLLLRAFYESLDKNANASNPFNSSNKNPNVNKFCDKIAECIWKLDDNYLPDKTKMKIKSEVSSDEAAEELQKIIETGTTQNGSKNKYAENYRYFQKQIEEFKLTNPQDFLILIKRIMDNAILLPIEASSQDTALRIFTTLNDRGMPLSDSDIFKAQFYKFYKDQGKQEKENFSKRWKELDKTCRDIFYSQTGLDDLFTCYMYYILASKGSRTSTLKGLRKFYEQNNYEYLRNEKSFEDLVLLADFWKKIYTRDDDFSENVLRKFYILRYSPYTVWQYVVSVYFLKNRDNLDDNKFAEFLDKVIAFTWAHAIDKPGVGSIRLPLMNEMVNITENKTDYFSAYKFSTSSIKAKLQEMFFSNQKMITRSMLAWWTFRNENQPLPLADTRFEIEHIYARNRNNFQPLKNQSNLEKLGNKILLEKRINIRAADYRFADKKKFYLGYKDKNGKSVLGTEILELQQLANTKNNFTETDIVERNEKIFSAFINYLEENNLLK